MIRDIGFHVHHIWVEAKLDDLGGGRVRVKGFYVEGKRLIPVSSLRQDVFTALAKAFKSEYKGKYELVDIRPSVDKQGEEKYR